MRHTCIYLSNWNYKLLFIIFQKLFFCDILIPKKPQRQKSSYLNACDIFNVIIWDIWTSTSVEKMTAMSLIHFFFPDDKWTVSYSTSNWISCIRNHYSLDVFIHIHRHKYKHTKAYILYIVKSRLQMMIATCQLVLFSSIQAFPGKIMQLLSYRMGICDSSCISTVYVRPQSSILDCVCWWHPFLVTAIS